MAPLALTPIKMISSLALPFQANYLLAALPDAELETLAPHLLPCLLHQGQSLCAVGDSVETLYFPKTGIISLVLSSQSGANVEVGIIGRDGALGGMEVLSEDLMLTRAMVQISGSGWKISAGALREQCAQSSALRTAILRASRALMQQTAQCVLCNRLHSVEQRLARWLLMCQDRMHTGELQLTHEFIAGMLGVRRASVTTATGVLRDAGLIQYSRGLVTISDRAGLEEMSCECYAVIHAKFDEMAPRDAVHVTTNKTFRA